MLRVLAHQVGDRPHRDGGGESVRLADDPVGHVAAVRTPADAHPVGVDVTLAVDELVERAHQVEIVLAGPVAHDVAAEALAVAVGAARVHIEDDVTHSRQDL